jgi:AAA domain
MLRDEINALIRTSTKRLPFKSSFIQKTVVDPLQIQEAFDWAETQSKIHTIVIDSLTYLLDMYESLYVLNSSNTIQAWGQFAQYFKVLMQQYVAKSTKRIIFTAHTSDALNEGEMVMETKVPVKGALKNNGINQISPAIQ